MARSIEIIGVPVDLGADRRGVDMGPSAIRYAGLKRAITNLKLDYRDLGNTNVPVPENSDEDVSDKKKYMHEINKVNKKLAYKVSKSLSSGNMPVVLGGDHSMAVGTILGTQ